MFGFEEGEDNEERECVLGLIMIVRNYEKREIKER
jgi:hypothetical protein